jgi:hypothetical protein
VLLGIISLKFVHFLSIFLAGGIGIGGAVIQSTHAKASKMPSPETISAIKKLAFIGLISIILLWLTGIGLAYSIYETMWIGFSFYVKLVGAAMVLGASIFSNLLLAKSGITKIPPNAAIMKKLVMLGRLGLVLVLAGVSVGLGN